MPVETMKFINRQDLRSRPDVLFIFGDNLERAGYGGQAAEMRDEPNAVGLPTKRAPSNAESAFFTDDDYPEAVCAMVGDMARLVAHVSAGGTVVIPEDGIGTGLAQLPRRAPKIAKHFDTFFKLLRSIK